MNNLAEKREGLMGLDDVMSSAEQKETVTKSKTPILKADEKLKTIAERVYNDKKALDMAEIAFKSSSMDLINAVSPQRLDMCQKEYVSSVKVPTLTGNLVGVTYSTNYTKILASAEKKIKELVGEEFGNSFVKKYSIQTKGDKDEKDFEQLIYRWLAPNDGATEEDVKVGIARFQSMFQVEVVLRPTEYFKRRHIFMSEAKKNDLELLGVKQFTPSIRTR